MKPIILAIDFDGTIVDHKYPKIGKLQFNAKEVINELYDLGFKIIIWTCRYLDQDLNNMKNFLDTKGIKYHKINENFDCLGFNPYPKIYADFYIDDRNIMFELNWLKIKNYLLEFRRFKNG